MSLFIILHENRLVRVVPLEDGEVAIGRRDTCDIRLEHHSVSRVHARVTLEGIRATIQDEGSTNGILVNGNEVTRSTLHHGDFIQVGEFSIYVDLTSPIVFPGRSAASRAGNEMQDAYTALEALFTVSSDFAALVNLGELLEKMLDCLLKIFQADRGVILLKSGEGLKPVVARKIESANANDQFSFTVIKRVAASGKPELINDIQGMEDLEGADSIQAAEIRSIICSALNQGSQLLGILYLDSQIKGRRYNEGDLKLLESFSSHAVHLIANAEEKDRLRRDLRTWKAIQMTESPGDFAGIIGTSGPIQKILAQARQVARRDVTTLVLGQSGTGKELLARAIHQSSPRSDRPFVAVNCMALSRDVIESELFGHEKGSFTGASERRIGRFELADGGTLFLDEIGELSGEIQVKLLRVLQEREIERVGSNQPTSIDVRLIAATNQNLQDLVAQGQFREDLYYRINVIALNLPPLSRRREDIPLLANHFVEYFNRQMGTDFDGLSRDAMEAMVAYNWPGNIRELRNVMERAFVLEMSEQITLESLPHDIIENARRGVDEPETDAQMAGVEAVLNRDTDFNDARTQFERTYVTSALKRNKGSVTATAQEIGMPRKSLYRKLEVLGIDLTKVQETLDITEKQLILDCMKKHAGNITAVSNELGIPRTSVYRKLTAYGVDVKSDS